MRILNLYAGLGGNRKLWEGHNVTAVELDDRIAAEYKKMHPLDTVVTGDAHDYLLKHYKEFDFVWSSPPCQRNSRLVLYTRHDLTGYPDLTLYEEVIFLKAFFAGKWVVENVKPYYEPLIRATECGRHLLWSNFYIPPIDIASPPDFCGNKKANKKVLEDWLGFSVDKVLYYNGNHDPQQVLRNCVHPALGLHVLKSSQVDQQGSLFK